MQPQPLDAITLNHLARELQPALYRGKITKIQQWTKNEYVLNFWYASAGVPPHDPRTEEAWTKGYINLNPTLPLFLLATADELGTLARAELARPTGFCMLLRKHLTGGLITTIETLPGEQVLNIVIENFSELGNRTRLILSLELMGKYTNMILVDDISGMILGAAHPVSDTMSSHREVLTGIPYEPPPRPEEKQPLLAASADTLTRTAQELGDEEWTPVSLVTQSCWGVRQALVQSVWGFHQRQYPEHLEGKSPLAQAMALLSWMQELATAEPESLQPAINHAKPRFTLHRPFEQDAADWLPVDSLMVLLHDYGLQSLITTRMEQLKKTMKTAITEQEKKRKRHLSGLTPVSDATIAQLQHYGDLLLMALSQGNLPGQHPPSGRIVVHDLEHDTDVTLAVDPAKDWSQNAQDYYRKARKAKSKKDVYESRLANLQQQEHYLAELDTMVDQCDRLADLDALFQDLITAGILRQRRPSHRKTRQGKHKAKQKGATPAPENTPGILCLTTSDGYPVWVGKSSHANGLLVGKWAKPNDIWFHVHNMPGSHVLLKASQPPSHLPPADPIPPSTLEEAATLAVYFSQARSGNNVPVISTESRYVRKIPGSYPGHVNYKEETGYFITVNPTTLHRVLQPDHPTTPLRRVVQ